MFYFILYDMVILETTLWNSPQRLALLVFEFQNIASSLMESTQSSGASIIILDKIAAKDLFEQSQSQQRNTSEYFFFR